MSKKDWRNSKPLGLILLVGIGALWFSMIDTFSGESQRPNIDLMCAHCDAQFYQPIPKGERPYHCPTCNKNGLYRSMKCSHCAHVFPLILPQYNRDNQACAKCDSPMEIFESYPTHLVCTDRECGHSLYLQEYFCFACDHTWAVENKTPEGATDGAPTPGQLANVPAPKACPQCKSEKFIPLELYVPFCPQCGEDELQPVTPLPSANTGTPAKSSESTPDSVETTPSTPEVSP